MSGPSTHWYGVLDAEGYKDAVVEQRHSLADAAKRADWAEVLRLLDTSAWISPNCWRLGGTSYFTTLHQAAWHGASGEVVSALLERGAWRSVRTADGRRALDIAAERGHGHLVELLEHKPFMEVALPPATIEALDAHFAALVESRIRPQLTVGLRHASTEVLTEIPSGKLWYPIPGMYGGFSIHLREHHLYVESWSRVVGGSGQAHVVTTEGTTLVNEGFV